ncbi:MAG: N-acetylneuraminate lyase [Candidatus Marinimicrobia bacterium]|jgi:N-acetylneuraminate lyase|nr:N-acetylneuraminate lyase [Candidatus Neomarinimicrobiota bacterium]MBT3675304.1 N-acetylneuraminate lyase [Candidatus Neomarinimicrobiota bacterium]MBT3762832.1 N-acetylneuraminate lyase [Candidatus Neomarinimicrobiota bacterium]MBT4068179.1 N-acetylneuraminate lyase [Candidatus Neomarinimicrobiota bacterium]MBT4270297.1 N-acetylneuraminate lyase [Candidatus Neomarinimicrobiota bacterium]
MKHKKLTGLIAAVHTPVHEDFSLNLDCVKTQAQHLAKCGVAGIYVSGTTGEGQSFSPQERSDLFQAWGQVAQENNLTFIAHIGHNDQDEALNLALAANDAGADILSAMGPPKQKINNATALVDWINPITDIVSNLPFYYYESPAISGVAVDMVEFLELADKKLKTLVGLKFNNPDLDMLQRCMAVQNGKFDILFGVDEMLIEGLDHGCKGAVGSTYNFAAPIYHKLVSAYNSGNHSEAQKLQKYSIQFIDIIAKYDFLPTAKALMKKFGVDCGPARPPHRQLSKNEIETLYNELDQINFFERANEHTK